MRARYGSRVVMVRVAVGSMNGLVMARRKAKVGSSSDQEGSCQAVMAEQQWLQVIQI